MEIEKLIKNTKIAEEKIKYNEPMSKYTTFKIGGKAECLVKIDNIQELKEILSIAKKNNIPLAVMGNGSNLLVSDSGIQGIVLIIKLEKIEIKKTKLIVGAGEKLGKLAQICLKEQITGLEELSGIPGTLGGAVKMNAGAHGKEMKDIVKSVKVIDYNGNEKNLEKEKLEFGYRTSIFKRKKYIITEVELELQKGNEEEIKKKMNDYMLYRKEKQPIEYPSAGSIFKKGQDYITSKLIDEAGLKGFRIGDAEISTKHAGFIINRGNATAKDVINLINYVKSTVYEKFGKKIELEIEVWGEKE